MAHYQLNPAKGQTVLYVGDLSYADDYPYHNNIRWDTWGRFTERSAAYQPWIWTAGNHEIDFSPNIVCIISSSFVEGKCGFLTFLFLLEEKPYSFFLNQES